MDEWIARHIAAGNDLVLTRHLSALTTGPTGHLSAGLVKPGQPPDHLIRLTTGAIGSSNQIVAGPLKGFRIARHRDEDRFYLSRDSKYLSVPPAPGAVTLDKDQAGAWETFELISETDAARCSRLYQQDGAALHQRLEILRRAGQPIKLHFGCGTRYLDDFLNIDGFMLLDYEGSNVGKKQNPDYFLFDFTRQRWPIADASVDYIYSEDFIEHVDQRSQLAYLAEAFRVLKLGAVHRISTPDLLDSMRKNSDFNKGFNGVYFGEFDLWGHVSLLTRSSLADLAALLGYRTTFFTAKSAGTSPHAVSDYRPDGDRDALTGNIFADLVR